MIRGVERRSQLTRFHESGSPCHFLLQVRRNESSIAWPVWGDSGNLPFGAKRPQLANHQISMSDGHARLSNDMSFFCFPVSIAFLMVISLTNVPYRHVNRDHLLVNQLFDSELCFSLFI
jgi:hypothetical protein